MMGKPSDDELTLLTELTEATGPGTDFPRSFEFTVTPDVGFVRGRDFTLPLALGVDLEGR